MITVTLVNGTKIEYNTFEEIVDHEQVVALDCRNNNLTVLPDSIGNFINLKHLNCQKNELTRLLNKVNKLFSLYTLNNQTQLVI